MPRSAFTAAIPRPQGTEKAWVEWTKHIEIREVAADAVAFSVDRSQIAAGRSRRVDVRFRLDPTSMTLAGEELTLGFQFELEMHHRQQRANKPTPFLQASMTYRATYTVPEGKTSRPDLADRFHKQIALAHVFPFVRAQLADLIMRAGLPPLYLPLGRPQERQAVRQT